MAIRSTHRRIIDSEQDSDNPRSLLVDSRDDASDGRTLILEWCDPSGRLDDRYAHHIELNHDEVVELVTAFCSVLEIKSHEIGQAVMVELGD